MIHVQGEGFETLADELGWTLHAPAVQVELPTIVFVPPQYFGPSVCRAAAANDQLTEAGLPAGFRSNRQKGFPSFTGIFISE